ncbi:MAG: CBS domain-containing protein [Flavobacterium sp.]
MKDNVSVASIMTKNLITLKANDELSHAESLFKKNKIRHIPVVENGEIIGMLSFTDLLRISFVDAVDDDAEDVDAEVYNLFTMRQVMTKNVVTITAETTIKQAAAMFLEGEFHALPVVENGKITGIVTTTDLLRYFISE